MWETLWRNRLTLETLLRNRRMLSMLLESKPPPMALQPLLRAAFCQSYSLSSCDASSELPLAQPQGRLACSNGAVQLS